MLGIMGVTKMAKTKDDTGLLRQVNKGKWLYIAAVVLAIAFMLIRIDILAVTAALLFIIGVVAESIESAREKGLAHEAKEIAVAIAVALAVLFTASIILGTSSPFNAVVSCSMLNTLQRGDVVLLQNAPVLTQEIALTEEQFNAMVQNGEEHYICSKCVDGGLTVRPCTINPKTGQEAQGNVLQYKCSICSIKTPGNNTQVICTEGVTINGVYFDATSRSGDIIVYRPKKDDLFALIGDIIHRAVVRIRVGNESYYLIKGDNNPMFDTQAYDLSFSRTNSLASSNQVLGKAWLTLPFLGYVKLVGTGQLAPPAGCDVLIGEPIRQD